MYASCYIGMNVSMWREIEGFKKGDNIMNVIAGMRNVLRGFMEGRRQWMTDQREFARRIRKWHGFSKQVHFVSRNRIEDRLN